MSKYFTVRSTTPVVFGACDKHNLILVKDFRLVRDVVLGGGSECV